MKIASFLTYQARGISIITSALILMACVAVAGEYHQATREDKYAAVVAANTAARDAAKKKRTCWKAAKSADCKSTANGWTATAESANEAGSCDRPGHLSPSASVYTEGPEGGKNTPDTKPNVDTSVFFNQWVSHDRETEMHINKDGTWRMVRGRYKGHGTWKFVGSKLVATSIMEENDRGVVTHYLKVYRKIYLDGHTEFLGNGVGSITLEPKAGGKPDEATKGTDNAAEGKQRYLSFAAIYERSGQFSNARVVVDKVEVLEGKPAAMREELRKEVESKYVTSNLSWVIHRIPDTTFAVIYRFTRDNGKIKGIAVAEGATEAAARAKMESDLVSFSRRDAEIIRNWPNASPYTAAKQTPANTQTPQPPAPRGQMSEDEFLRRSRELEK